jgi:hypothetical protein
MADQPAIIRLDTPEGTQLGRLYNLAQQMRGSFMEQAIWIDVILTDILARYFAPDESKRMFLSSEVLAGPYVSFSGRISILERIISRSYVPFGNTCPKLCEQLNKIRRFRNRLAHAHLDASDAFMAKWPGDRIQIVFYEDSAAKTQVITVEENNSRLKECSAVVLQLLELQTLVISAPRK